jgi:arginase
MSSGVQDFAPVAEEDVVLVGARDLDPAEREFLSRSPVRLVAPEDARSGGLAEALDALASRVQRVYLHVDLDVHDPGEGAANAFAAPGGLTAEEVRGVVREVAARVPIAAAALTAYDPAFDTDGRMLNVGMELMELTAELAGGAETA